MAMRPLTAEAQSARHELPGWEIWETPNLMGPLSWSARPFGATVAPPGCSAHPSLDSLVEAVQKYQGDLRGHIRQTAKELEETPASWIGRVSMLKSRLEALKVLLDYRISQELEPVE